MSFEKEKAAFCRILSKGIKGRRPPGFRQIACFFSFPLFVAPWKWYNVRRIFCILRMRNAKGNPKDPFSIRRRGFVAAAFYAFVPRILCIPGKWNAAIRLIEKEGEKPWL